MAATLVRRGTDGRTAVAAAFGACAGVSGLDHGFVEARHGNAAGST